MDIVSLPPANGVWGKVIFLRLAIILFTGGSVVSQHALQVVSQYALQQVSRGWYPSMPCRFPGPHPRGKLRWIWQGESPGPHLGGCLLQGGACSMGYLLWGPALGGPDTRGVPAQGGCLLQGSVWRTPHVSNAAGGTHPTGLHSCSLRGMYCRLIGGWHSTEIPSNYC